MTEEIMTIGKKQLELLAYYSLTEEQKQQVITDIERQNTDLTYCPTCGTKSLEINTLAGCTGLSVLAAPVVTITDKCWATGSPSNCIGSGPSCSINISSLTAYTVSCIASVSVTNATAKYDLRVDYYKDGVAQSYTITGMTSAIGTYNYYLSSGTSWAVGNYTGLTVTPQNIVAA